MSVNTKLPPCWEIVQCGRERGGPRVAEAGECPASRLDLGHACWAVAGTLCRGEAVGVRAATHGCMSCEVYARYNRATGTQAQRIPLELPDEEQRYRRYLLERMHARRISS